MDNNAYEKPIFLLKDTSYKGSHPCFYKPENFDWVSEVENKWEVIRDEITQYLQSGNNIEGRSTYVPPDMSSPTGWKNMYFMNFKWIQYGNCKKLPKTWSILKDIPGVTFAAVGILDPGASVLPHFGETNTNIRCHLGIKIPGQLPECGIRVGDEKQGWKEGKVLMFSDCHNHTTWNNTNETRIVVGFDIMKKEYAEQSTWMCAQFLGAQSLRFFDSYIPFMLKTPTLLLSMLHKIFSAIWYVYLPIQAKFGILHN